MTFGNLFLELTFRTNQNIRFETFPLIFDYFFFLEKTTLETKQPLEETNFNFWIIFSHHMKTIKL